MQFGLLVLFGSLYDNIHLPIISKAQFILNVYSYAIIRSPYSLSCIFAIFRRWPQLYRWYNIDMFQKESTNEHIDSIMCITKCLSEQILSFWTYSITILLSTVHNWFRLLCPKYFVVKISDSWTQTCPLVISSYKALSCPN